MKLFRFPTFFCLLACSFLNTLHAQSPQPPEIPRFLFNATAIGFEKTPSLYWLDYRFDAYGKEIREYKPFQIPVGSRSTRLEMPVRNPVSLYTKIIGENGEDVYNPAFTIPDPQKDSQILMVLTRRQTGQVHVNYFPDDETSHPGGTVRLANFSGQKVIAGVNKNAQAVNPGEIKSLGTPEYDRPGVFNFIYALKIEGRNFTAPKTRLKFASDRHRLLVIFTYVPTYQETGAVDKDGQKIRELQYRPMSYQLFDRLPKKVAPPPVEE